MKREKINQIKWRHISKSFAHTTNIFLDYQPSTLNEKYKKKFVGIASVFFFVIKKVYIQFKSTTRKNPLMLFVIF